MPDPRPVTMLLVLQALLLAGLVLWWGTLAAEHRQGLLRAVWWQEGATLHPPAGLLEQPGWLCAHRLAVGTGLLGIGVVAGVIAVAEGMAWRRQDPLGGYRLVLWTSGVVGLALAPGLVLGWLLTPWPLTVRLAGGGLAVWVGITCYALAAGRPAIR